MPTTITTRGTSISIMATTTTIRTTTNTFDWLEPESESAAPYFDLRAVDTAYRQCRKRKRNKVRTCLYEQQLLDNLLLTSQQLQNLSWQPLPPVVFTVLKPKAREVCAAQFADRVVHHLLFNYLEPLLEKELIYDVASNRKGKGTHFAVNRLKGFMQKYSGISSGGYFLQLDIRNFFYSVHQHILIAQLQQKLSKWANKGNITKALAKQLLWLTQQVVHQSINYSVAGESCIRLGSAAEFNRIPKHKRLESVPVGQGLPIGNLTSQLLANLYLNDLDQFVKHQLKCKHYVRYVDDFVLCHSNKQQLREWHLQIAEFLQQRLKLHLKPQFTLAPIDNGADFLGYIVRPHYTLVRKRVLGNFHEKMQWFERCIVKPQNQGVLLDLHPDNVKKLRATLASYWGHFKHANSYRLCGALVKRYSWLKLLFGFSSDWQQIYPLYEPQTPLRYKGQQGFFAQYFPQCCLLMQCGNRVHVNPPRQQRNYQTYSVPMHKLNMLRQQMQKQGVPYVLITENGYARIKNKRRAARLMSFPQNGWRDYTSAHPTPP